MRSTLPYYRGKKGQPHPEGSNLRPISAIIGAMIRRIISFDLTGTLTTYRFSHRVWFEELPRLFAQKNKIGLDEARERLKRIYGEVGEESPEWYDLKYWFRRLDLGNGWQELLESASTEIEFYPETKQVVEKLSQSSDLVLLTNAAREFVEVEVREIKSYFRSLFSCVSDFGQVKKTPEFFLEVCKVLGVKPGELIHVGDHWKFDYLAPRQAGVRAFYLDRSRKARGKFILHDLQELEERISQVAEE